MSSFTDEQLLNLVNTTIVDAGHSINDFTGGSVQVTTAYNHKIINYKILLFFGYDENRHPITYTEEIHKDTYSVWTEAILLKVSSLKTSTSGDHIRDLNRRMNSKISKNETEVVGKEVVGIGRGRGSGEGRASVRANNSQTDKKFKTFMDMRDFLRDNYSKYKHIEVEFENHVWKIGKNGIPYSKTDVDDMPFEQRKRFWLYLISNFNLLENVA